MTAFVLTKVFVIIYLERTSVTRDRPRRYQQIHVCRLDIDVISR